MPLLGEGHSDLVRDEAPYFNSIAEFDKWSTQSHHKLSGVMPYLPRRYVDSRAKLLVCHDYKGGYTESPSGLCYTFNFWRLCDTFVYFSHHCVTVPPSGWTNAAHKQGTKMLGTLIFEGFRNPDCLQLIVGRADYAITDKKIPISKRYAALLAELAYQRGFDGYLLNFESDLSHDAIHAHALAGWILLLKAELRAKIGPHAQVLWYDSVIYNGEVHYQNRLNGFNLPFFLASDALFTNYWWLPKTQVAMTQYFNKLEEVSSHDASTKEVSFTVNKTLQDVYSGVDVWPDRGQYGDSGFCCYRAISHTFPRGFSTAMFAPAWTWESATPNPEQNWVSWWETERKLWLGPLRPGEVIEVPVSPEGPFKPMIAFFSDLPHPDPSKFVFYTHFSPGVGYSWFVEGKKVLDTKKGWTDVDKQSSIGNLVWPWPTPSWEGDKQEEAPTASTVLDMTEGYNGGNTLKLTLTYTDVIDLKTVWLPVQSLAVATREAFEARVVFKTTASSDIDINSRIYVKHFPGGENDDGAFLTIDQANIASDLSQGWMRQTVNFTSTSTSTGDTASVAIGFFIGIRPKLPGPLSKPTTFSLSLGYLAVYPKPPPESVSVGMPSVTLANFARIPRAELEGVITWDTASTFAPIDVLVEDAESIVPAWRLQDTPAYRFPTFVYFNVYAAPLVPDAAVAHVDPSGVVFIGTTGLDGRANRFYVESACLPNGWKEWAGVRFYVQGVTDRGEVLPWERCAFVDVGKVSDE